VPTDTTTPLLIDAAECCRLLCIGKTSLKKMLRTGRFPLKRYRLCRKLLFTRVELQQWVDAGMPHASRWAQLKEISALRRTG